MFHPLPSSSAAWRQSRRGGRIAARRRGAARAMPATVFSRDLHLIPLDRLGMHESALRSAMLERLEARSQLEICRLPLWASINHMEGWHLELPGTAAGQRVETELERRVAIERWASLGSRVDQEIANARNGLRQGYSSPRPVVRKVIKQLDGLLRGPVDRSPLYSPAERSDDAAFRRTFGGIVEGPVRLALSRYRDFLQTEYLPRARETLGISSHPDGKACYAAFLRRHTTMARSPEEVYRLGQQTVGRALTEVAELGKAHLGTSDITEIVKRLPQDPQNRFRSEEELIAFSRNVVASAVGKSRSLFVKLPEQAVHVEPFPEVQRGSGRSAHYQPQLRSDQTCLLPHQFGGMANRNTRQRRLQQCTRVSQDITFKSAGLYPGRATQSRS